MAFQRAARGPITGALLVLAALCASQPASAQYTQLGDKLVGTGAVDSGCGCGVQQGTSVALSADGNTAVVGGPNDDGSFSSSVGAAWVFRRNGGTWSQFGLKMVGRGADGRASQGVSVALSGDRRTILIGGPFDSNDLGATWVFVSAVSHDINADSKSDIAWRDATGNRRDERDPDNRRAGIRTHSHRLVDRGPARLQRRRPQ
jgi:hypothetical protein